MKWSNEMSKQLEFGVTEAITVAVLIEREIEALEKDLAYAVKNGKGGFIVRNIERDIATLRTVLAKLDTVYTLYAKEA
jgi:hypothetical protein